MVPTIGQGLGLCEPPEYSPLTCHSHHVAHLHSCAQHWALSLTLDSPLSFGQTSCTFRLSPKSCKAKIRKGRCSW